MSKPRNQNSWAAMLLATALSLASVSASAQDESGAESRWSMTTQFTNAARNRGEAGSTSHDGFPELSTEEPTSAAKTSRGQSKPSGAESLSPNTDFWFYGADVVLFNDHDGDGYYHGIDLLFDADTIYDFAEVYAVVYLSLEGGPWNEYAVTDNFAIYGASSEDEYVIVTELMSGYPTGSYDLLIELFDTYDGAFVASFGPADTSELALLQLEDAQRDAPQTTTVIVTERGGGGSLGWLMLLILLLVARRVSPRRSPGS